MKIGKVSESVLKRSILKQIKTKRNEVLNGAGVGEDCAILAFKEAEHCAVSTEPLVLRNGRTVRHAIIRAVNNLAAGGAEPVAVTIAAMLPKSIEEPQIKILMAEAESVCAELNIQLAGGHTSVSEAVNCPILTVTGVGKIHSENVDTHYGKASSGRDAECHDTVGLDIVATKWIGLEATAVLAKEKEKDLLTRYPTHLVEEAKGFEKYLSVIPEAATAVKSGAFAMHDVSEGGIFGALWELAEKLGVGLEIDLKKIPVKQETIEVCEYFDLNPYELISGGCLLIAVNDGFDLVNALAKEQIAAVVIGKTTDSNDRVIIKDEERRFLEPRKTDEFYKVKF
ncbi:MAG: hydrogenase maturation factor [Lachnospiraceae bacterium]|nr:hydrogenase maturation factor [Lachnospiraceae bacterium]